eukprot:m.343166 g.343166  ORF g.343166 m.343166 type:complete len:210 (+) comp22437_c0_seq1:235-864(+)
MAMVIQIKGTKTLTANAPARKRSKWLRAKRQTKLLGFDPHRKQGSNRVGKSLLKQDRDLRHVFDGGNASRQARLQEFGFDIPMRTLSQESNECLTDTGQLSPINKKDENKQSVLEKEAVSGHASLLSPLARCGLVEPLASGPQITRSQRSLDLNDTFTEGNETSSQFNDIDSGSTLDMDMSERLSNFDNMETPTSFLYNCTQDFEDALS